MKKKANGAMMLLGAATLLLLLGGGGCSASAPVGTELAPKRVMLWLGPPAWDHVNKQLNASQLAATKANLTKFKDSITVIGTVGYSIDPGSPGFWKPNHPGVEQFNAEMIKMGFKVHPLIGGLCEDNSVCMKPLCGNLTGNACQIKYFRQIWAKPQPFIDQAVARIKAGGWDGVNIDFETGSGTADDAAKFAKFLGLLADAVHKAGARVSVDTNWGPYLNPGTLSQGNTVDTFCDMQTVSPISKRLASRRPRLPRHIATAHQRLLSSTDTHPFP